MPRMTTSKRPGLSYRDAGVDIERGEALVERIKPGAAATRRAGVLGGLGGFGGLFDLAATGYADPLLVSSTDGVGTKLLLAIELDAHATIGIDLVAMCVNDVVVQGAEPLLFLDYFATGSLALDTAEQVINGIARVAAKPVRPARRRDGGNARHVSPGHDLAGFCVGVVERTHLLDGSAVSAGDVILGLAASGCTPTATRWCAASSTMRGRSTAPGKARLSALPCSRRPVSMSNPCSRHAAHTIHALAHITGGGLTENIPRAARARGAHRSHRLAAPHPVRWLAAQGGVAPAEMLRTFNCGIGMVVIAPADAADALAAALAGAGETVHTLGHIAPGPCAVVYHGTLDLGA